MFDLEIALEALHRLDRSRVGAGVRTIAVGVDHQRIDAAEARRDLVRRDVELVVRPEQRRAGRGLADLRVEERDVGRDHEQEHDGHAADHVLPERIGRRPAHAAHEAHHEARQEVLVLGRRRHVADQDRVQDLDRDDDRRHPERAEETEVVHLRDRREHDHQQAGDVGDDRRACRGRPARPSRSSPPRCAPSSDRRSAAASPRSLRRSARPSARCARRRAR